MEIFLLHSTTAVYSHQHTYAEICIKSAVNETRPRAHHGV